MANAMRETAGYPADVLTPTEAEQHPRLKKVESQRELERYAGGSAGWGNWSAGTGDNGQFSSGDYYELRFV